MTRNQVRLGAKLSCLTVSLLDESSQIYKLIQNRRHKEKPPQSRGALLFKRYHSSYHSLPRR